jgi:hypothetical protein
MIADYGNWSRIIIYKLLFSNMIIIYWNHLFHDHQISNTILHVQFHAIFHSLMPWSTENLFLSSAAFYSPGHKSSISKNYENDDYDYFFQQNDDLGTWFKTCNFIESFIDTARCWDLDLLIQIRPLSRSWPQTWLGINKSNAVRSKLQAVRCEYQGLTLVDRSMWDLLWDLFFNKVQWHLCSFCCRGARVSVC